MFDAGKYTVHFKHNKATTKQGRVPKSTLCFITRGEQVVCEGISKPVREIPVYVKPNEDPSLLYGNRLKKVLRMDDGTRIAVLSGDKFKYSTGRKEALAQAMANGGFTAKERKEIWEAYKKRCKC